MLHIRKSTACVIIKKIIHLHLQALLHPAFIASHPPGFRKPKHRGAHFQSKAFIQTRQCNHCYHLRVSKTASIVCVLVRSSHLSKEGECQQPVTQSWKTPTGQNLKRNLTRVQGIAKKGGLKCPENPGQSCKRQVICTVRGSGRCRAGFCRKSDVGQAFHLKSQDFHHNRWT